MPLEGGKMQEFNVINLLNKFSGEIILAVVVACVVGLIAKRYFKLSDKFFIGVCFLLATIFYYLISLFIIDETLLSRFVNGITSGILATTVAMILKKFIYMENGDIKKSLEKLLSSIVLSEQLDEVVDNIIEKLANHSEQTKEGLKELISKNVNATLSEDELENIINFIISACGIDEKKED